MFRFENDTLLIWLLLIPALSLIFAAFVYGKKRRMNIFARRPLMERLSPLYSQSKYTLKFILLMSALALLIVSLANPQMGSKVEKVHRTGVDLMICLDISESMNAEDIQPSRLKRAKQAINRLFDKLRNDRIGIVVFAGSAYTQLPLTSDYGAAKMFIDVISTDDMQAQGTAIGAAIEMAMTAFDEDKDRKKNKAIIVISDGEDHEENAIEAAKNAKHKGIVVHTIGMGLPEGAPIPQFNGNRMVGYKYDRRGNLVLTKLNEQMLKDIAEAGGGYYVGANNASAGVETLFSKIEQLDKKAFDERNFSDYETRFQYVLIFVILLLLLEIFIFKKKNKFINHDNLFGTKKS
ncbi:MAG: VWA domain-containing protein [Bacteroidales bacterium]|jgi:Ca-activated chloride channel family protein|nr:VWA domain-containing protein [Bacteroidales bacterium]